MPNDSSFDEVYEQIFLPVFQFVRLRVPASDVDDVTAEVIAKVWRALPRFEAKSSLKTWALRIAYHQVADYYRSQKLKPTVQLQVNLAESNTADDHSEKVATLLSVSQTLAKMPRPQVAVIQLRLVENFSAAETGEILGLTQKAVDSLLYRAKKSFRKIYALESAGGKSR